MARPPALVAAALATWNGKALTKAKKDISSFEKSVKSVGKAFGVAFAASTIINYSKKSVDAFVKDQAAAKALEIQLKNTGYAFSAPDIEYYIANLQAMTGVLDDQLRPAFQTLLTASGSLIKSQKALAIALDVSVATGKSVEEVSAAIAKGFTGQTTALSRLGAGLDAATLKSGDMNQILDELGNKFSGQAQARLSTFAGKIDLLKVSAANASETIGKGLLDSLSLIGKDQNIKSLGNAMEKVATTIANIVVALGAVLGKIAQIGTDIFTKLHLDKIISFLYSNSLINLISKFGASQTDKPTSNFTYSLGSGAATEIAKLQELKARKALIVTLKAEADLKKLKDKYDIERIGLMAALNQATDDETKLRLAEKLAILDGNAAMAQKYLADLEATNSTTQLANAMNQAANDILTAGQMILLGLGLNPSQMVGSTISSTAIAGFPDIRNLANVALNNPNFGTSPEAMGLGLALGFTPGSTNMGAPTEAPPINLQLVVDGSAFANAVQSAQLTNNRNGITTVPAGQGF